MLRRIPDWVYIMTVLFIVVILPLGGITLYARQQNAGHWYGVQLDADFGRDTVDFTNYSWGTWGKGPMSQLDLRVTTKRTLSLADTATQRSFLTLDGEHFYCYPSEPDYVDSAAFGFVADRAVYTLSSIVNAENLVPPEVYNDRETQVRLHTIGTYCLSL